MANEKLWALVRKLKTKTDEGRVVWEETTIDGEYQAALPGYSVVIAENTSQWSEDYVQLTINDSHGRMIETVGDSQLDSGTAEKEARRLMRQMYDTARRQALGVDEAIDAVIQALDQDVAM